MTAISGSVTMRRAGPGDAKAIATLTNAAYIKYIPRIGRQPRPMTENYSQVLLEHPVWLLMLSDRPVGVLVLMLEHEAMLIYSVAVDPKYQKRGLGRRLLSFAEEQAQGAGYARIRLYTNERMVENIALYRRLGYEETGREPIGDTSLVHMAKTLERKQA
jgi:ribosomal protein S18 acetylase RimI-like enzyme